MYEELILEAYKRIHREENHLAREIDRSHILPACDGCRPKRYCQLFNKEYSHHITSCYSCMNCYDEMAKDILMRFGTKYD